MSNKEIRIPKQARSIEKKKQLKQAALILFSEKGFHNTSSNEIAKKAGLSIGTFYSYFTDKTALYEELVKDLYQDALAQIPDIGIENEDDMIPDPAELIRSYIQTIMQIHTYMPAFQKEITSLSQQYEEFRVLEEKYRSYAAEKVLRLLQGYRKLLRITDFATAGMIIQNSLEAVVHEVQFYHTSYDKDKVIDELTDMLCRYVIKAEYLK